MELRAFGEAIPEPEKLVRVRLIPNSRQELFLSIVDANGDSVNGGDIARIYVKFGKLSICLEKGVDCSLCNLGESGAIECFGVQ